MENKIFRIIIIILISLIVLTSVGGTILYVTTDILKSKDELFQKYMAQNIQNIVDVIDVSQECKNIDLLAKSDYQETANLNLKYLENKNDKEEIYKIKETGIIKNTEKNSYRNISVTYEDVEIMTVDLLEEDDKYGFRLANLVDQFVSVENATVSYFVSSMGYNGEYFSEKMKKVDISGLFDFSKEEIQQLTDTYRELIFSDISKDNYSSKSNALITLNNGESVTTKAYTLTITKNEYDRIYKKVLNYAIEDPIILGKLEKIDAKIQEVGFIQPEGKSLKEMFIAKLKEISSGLEYQGTDRREISFTVNEKDGTTVRTAIEAETTKVLIDLDETNGKTVSLKIIEQTDEGEDTKVYTIGKVDNKQETARILAYNDSKKNLEVKINTINKDNQIAVTTNLDYNSDEIANFSTESNTEIVFGTNEAIPMYFKENNNILLNDYEGPRILSILNSLKHRVISSLEESQSKINSKLLNNIIVDIDAREKKLAEEEENDEELKKKRFNNQFILYGGEKIEYEEIQKMLKIVSNNMSDYKVITGNQIRIFIEEGTKNAEKAEEIATAIQEEHKYNVDMKYSEDGYIRAIDISVYKDKEAD